MSADFWAGYISGAAGILIGNPLDLIKVRLQASPRVSPSTVLSSETLPTPGRYADSSRPSRNPFTTASSLIRGATAPILGYGALNAILFITYNRSLALLTGTPYPPASSSLPRQDPSLSATFLAGVLGGLATFVISTPTELIKCRAQVSGSTSNATPAQSSWAITKDVWRAEGIRGLYFGGTVTALRDGIGYGFYFWSYEIMTRWMRDAKFFVPDGAAGISSAWSHEATEAMKVLLCGGVAGVVTWASVFPLDVIKTRVQTQVMTPVTDGESTPLLSKQRKIGAWEMAKRTYTIEGANVFWRGLGVCSLRAFIVNAAQWAVYEYIMDRLEPSRKITPSTTL